MVPQTFQDVLNILNRAVNRPDIAPSYMDFINRAIRDIAVLHSFDQMALTAAITLPNGQNQVALPANFKEVQSGRFPIYASIGGAPVVPVPLFLKEEISRIQTTFMPAIYLIFTSDNNGFQVGLLPGQTVSANWVMTLYYYAYPDVVTDPTQGTQLLTFFPNLVLARTLSLIFQSINDPIWEEHEKSFTLQMQGFMSADDQIKQPESSN